MIKSYIGSLIITLFIFAVILFSHQSTLKTLVDDVDENSERINIIEIESEKRYQQIMIRLDEIYLKITEMNNEYEK